MTLIQAIDLIKPAVNPDDQNWADIGAGTGIFTEALIHILSAFGKASADGGGQSEAGQPLTEKRGSRVYAVDKSPHALWALKSIPEVEIVVVDADFSKPLDLPILDGIVMANALHYAPDHLATLKNIISSLKFNGTFILVEYDTESSRPPWVPYPVSFKMFERLCAHAGLTAPSLIGTADSVYGSDPIYAAFAIKQQC